MTEPSSIRTIRIEKSAVGHAIVSGDGSTVYVIHPPTVQRSVQAPSETLTTIGPNPYKGLAAFKESDADRYFGREAQVERLWQRFQALYEPLGKKNAPLRLLSILGPSGCGKSSLARAGLIPELARRPLPGRAQMRVVVLVPGSHPIQALAVMLARVATQDPTPVRKTREFATELRLKTEAGLYDGMRRIADLMPHIPDSPLVVLVEQFEEIYTLCQDPEERQAFIENLLCAANDATGYVSVVVTLRSDFLGETQRHEQLNQVIGSDQSVIVPAMTEAELRRAIAEPAKQSGYSFDQATVNLLIEETINRAGTLSLLQLALTRIWQGLTLNKSPLETLKEIGGVGGVLADEAERIYQNLSDKEQTIAHHLFLRLVQRDEEGQIFRQRVRLNSLISGETDSRVINSVINRFASPSIRLITVSSLEGSKVVELSHEAVFHQWKRFQNWMIERPRNENVIINRIKSEISNRLGQSLIENSFIDISFTKNDQSNASIPKKSGLLEILNELEFAGQLLLLGVPGSGKTTAMVKLTQTLLARAEYNSAQPIPVLFSLSSWQQANLLEKNMPTLTRMVGIEKPRTFLDWLVNELKEKYGVKSSLGEQWLSERKLIPLLDGLDEVKPQKLEACITSINQFIQSDQSPTYIAIACRTQTYSSVRNRLQLNGAIELRPLSSEQILKYLEEIGCNRLERFLEDNQEFVKIINSPLKLSLTALLYKANPEDRESRISGISSRGIIEPETIENIKRIVELAIEYYESSRSYSLSITSSKRQVSSGETICIKLDVSPGGTDASEAYSFEVSGNELEDELNIFLTAPGFFTTDTATSLLPSDNNTSQTSQSIEFSLTALSPGHKLVTVEIYRGEMFETTLTLEVDISGLLESEFYTFIPAKSRPVSQPDLILQIQSCWDEAMKTCKLSYVIDGFHPQFMNLEGYEHFSRQLPVHAFQQTLGQIQKVLDIPSQGGNRILRSSLQSIGQYLFQSLFSAEMRDFLNQLYRTKVKLDILILADQGAWLPWELIHNGQQFLGQRFTISRWPLELDSSRHYEFPIGITHLGYYASIEQPETWIRLLEVLGAPLPVLLSDGTLVDLNSIEAMRGLHLLRKNESQEALDRQDAPVLLDDTETTHNLAQEVRAIKLNLRRNRPLVSLGYLSAEQSEWTNLTSTWASTFIRAGCSAFVGPLWAVQPQVEAAFVSTFYSRLWAGKPLGESFRAARQMARVAVPDSMDWLAYVLFGDPMARPYRPESGQGYAIVEPVGQDIDQPVMPGARVRFRASLRRKPPIWYENRLMNVAETLEFDQLKIYVVTSELQVEPGECIDMTKTPGGDYLGWFTLTVPVELTGRSALVQVHFEDGMEPIHSLRFAVQVADADGGAA